MQQEINRERRKRWRKGQTLAEFGLSIPIVLVLMFGIVEFGRLFQAWVSIQNSARTAARFAANNEIMERYDDPALIKFDRNDDRNSLVPCVFNEDLTGLPLLQDPVFGVQGNKVPVYQGQEGLFATWYQGRDCDPQSEVDQDLRRDLLRIASIYETAYWASIGREDFPALSVQPIGIQNIDTEGELRDFLFTVWNPDFPQYDPLFKGTGSLGSSAIPDNEGDLRGYFSVMMCSNRPFLYENSSPIFETEGAFDNQRFIQVTDPDPEDNRIPQQLKTVVSGSDSVTGTNMPGCFLNENPAEVASNTLPTGTRWLDPGSGGSRVTVVVSFFHPLVTPLGFAEFIPIHARRSAIVEDFRGAGAAAAFNPLDANAAGAGDAIVIDTDDDEEPTEEVEPSITPSETWTPTPTRPPAAFDCANIYIVESDFNDALPTSDRLISFEAGKVRFRIYNENPSPAILESVNLNWSSAEYEAAVISDPTTAVPVPNYPGFYFSEFKLNGETLWEGTDTEPNTDTSNPADGQAITSQIFEIPGTINGGNTVWFDAEYENGPQALNYSLPRGAFGGTTFRIRDSVTDQLCPQTLNGMTFLSETETLDQDVPDDEITDCASEFVDFGLGPSTFNDFGWVKLVITNNHPTAPAPISDFNVTWGRWQDREESGSVRLEGIYVGGSTPPEGVEIWRSSDPAGTALDTTCPGCFEGDSLDNPGVYGTVTRASGIWTVPGGADFTIPPGSSRNFWLDLNGDNPATDGRNMKPFDFNGTRVTITCLNDGGGDGGNGTPPNGEVDINEEPLPNPSPTVEQNDKPRANTDNYTLSNLNVYNRNASNGVLVNDTDCGDTTPSRLNVLTPCSDDSNPSTFNNNGDGISADTGHTCFDNNGCTTDRGANIKINADGSFRYDPTVSTYLNCQASGTVTDTVNYRIVDGRGAKDGGQIRFTINLGNGGGNQPPSGNDVTYDYDMRSRNNPISSSQNGVKTGLQLFSDPNGDSFNIIDTQGGSGGASINSNNGSWSFDPWDDNGFKNLGEGQTKTKTLQFKVSDGDSLCGESNWVKIRIRVTGWKSDPPPPPPPDEDDGGFEGPGGAG